MDLHALLWLISNLICWLKLTFLLVALHGQNCPLLILDLVAENSKQVPANSGNVAENSRAAGNNAEYAEKRCWIRWKTLLKFAVEKRLLKSAEMLLLRRKRCCNAKKCCKQARNCWKSAENTKMTVLTWKEGWNWHARAGWTQNHKTLILGCKP